MLWGLSAGRLCLWVRSLTGLLSPSRWVSTRQRGSAMGLFKRKRLLPQPPVPTGPDEWLGNDEVGHTVRELMYMDALKDAGVDLEGLRTLAFGFASTSEDGAQSVSAALAATPFAVNT